MSIFGPPNIDKLRAKKDLPGLIKALRYPNDSRVRQAAAFALGDLRSPQAVEPLIAVLNARNETILEQETKKIDSGKKAIDALLAIFQGSDLAERRAAAEALGKIGDARARDALLAAVIDMSIFELVHKAIRSLSLATNSRDTSALAYLDTVRTRIWQAVEANLTDNQKDVRLASTEALGKLGSLAVEPLITILAGNVDGQMQTLCLLLNAPASVLATLRSSSERIRSAAAAALGEIGDEAAVDALIDCLKDQGESVSWILRDSESVRMRAVDALGKMGNPKAVKVLGSVLKQDNSWVVRRSAAVFLGRMGSKASLGPLIAALKDSSEMVRSAAAFSLGKIGSAQATEPLVAAMEDKDKSVVDAATRALALIRNA